MPPKIGSRHMFVRGRLDENGCTYLTEREPYPYTELVDNEWITAKQGDSWWGYAARYWPQLPRACGFFWAICDFQPTPILDPTIPPQPGDRIVIPSMQTLVNRILGEGRREEH